jgi:hypothetical protein
MYITVLAFIVQIPTLVKTPTRNRLFSYLRIKQEFLEAIHNFSCA